MTTIDTTAPIKDIEMDQGKTLQLPFSISRNSSPVDCTDYTLRAQFRKSYATSDVAINCTVANGKLSWVNQALGQFQLTLADTDTSYAGNPKITFAQDESSIDLVYDIEMVNLNTNVVFCLVKGTLTINREVTR